MRAIVLTVCAGILILVLVLAASLGPDEPEPPRITAAKTDSTVAWIWIGFGFKVLFGAALLAALVVAIVAGYRLLDKKAREHQAGAHGLYPLWRQGRALVDPNRAPGGVVIYDHKGRVLLPEPESTFGQQATTQAQAAQALAAASHAGGLPPQAAKLLATMNQPAAPALPQIVVMEPSHAQRLLAETVEADD